MKVNKADLLKFKALIKALDSDKIKFIVDYNVLHRPGSPVYNPWDALLPLLFIVLISLSVIFSCGAYIGLLTLVIGFIIYIYIIKKILTKFLKNKVQKYMVKNPVNWNKIWDFGGVVLVSNINNQGVVSPTNDWKEFIVINFSELMIDDGKDEEEKENN